MDQIEWTDDFSVGVAVLDEQHKQMIEIVNSLIGAPGATVDSKTVAEVLRKMTEYSQVHFTEEERLFKEHGYPDAEAHKERHKEFIQQAVVFCDSAILHIDVVPERLLLFLKDWWVNHLLGDDMKYKEFFAEKGVK